MLSLLTVLNSALLPLPIADGLLRLPAPVAQVIQLNPSDLFREGTTAFQNNDYEAAITAWQQALASFQAQGDRASVARTFNALAAAYLSAGHYQDAIAASENSLAIAQALQRPDLLAPALGNRGIALQALGRYAEAVETYEQALTLAPADNPTAIAQLQGLIANAYEALGDYSAAIAAQQTSLEMATATAVPSLMATAQMNLGGLYSLQGDYDTAITWYERGIALALEQEFFGSAAYGLNNLGGTYQLLGQTPAAIARFQESLALAEDTQNLTLQATVLTNLGVAYERQTELEEALAHHEAALAIARSLNNPRLLAEVLNNYAHTQLLTHRPTAAETALQESIQLLSQLRQGLTDADKINIFDTQIYTYNLLMQVQVAQGNYEAALVTAELGRARAFVETVAGDRTNLSPPTIANIRQVARTLDATLVEYAIVPEADFTVQGRQRGKAGEIFIWVVAPTGEVTFTAVSLAELELDLAAQIQQARMALGATGRQRGIGVQAVDNTGSTAQLQMLYTQLIAPIEAALPSNPDDLVIVIPHESLFYVPFPVLQNGAGEYLIEQHTLLTVPAIQLLDLTLTADQPAVEKIPLVVGNPDMPSVPSLPALPPLPGAAAEAQAIAQLLQTEPLLGEAATEAQVTAALPQAAVVHLATHGLLDYVDRTARLPVPGAIALTASDTDDGLLTAREIAQLTLTAQMVVLSACDTGLGEVTGDGIVGLSRSLLAAGAQSTVVSLWSVPDEPTALLMQAFYTELRAGKNKAQALRQAMLQTRAIYPEPLAWAAFALVGNPAPLQLSE